MNATTSSILSVAPYNFSSGLVGTTYLAPVIGGVLGAFWSGIVADKIALRLARANNGIREPEQRLWPLALTGIFFGAGIILWGVGAAHGIHWFGLVVANGMVGFGVVSGGSIAMSYDVDCFKVCLPTRLYLVFAHTCSKHYY